MKTAKEFVAELKGNPELENEVMNIKSGDEAKKFMEKYEISGTEQELINVLTGSVMARAELSDDELEKVAGGTPSGYVLIEDADSIEFYFNIGDKVKVVSYSSRVPTYSSGTIIGRHVAPVSQFGPYANILSPWYTVQFDGGPTEDVTQFYLSY